MAEIIYEPKQVEALREIQNSLHSLWKLNVVSTENPQLELNAETSYGRITIPLDEKESAKFIALLLGQQSKLKQSIKTRASKYRISLDEHDYDILNGSIERKGSTPSRRKRGKKSSTTPEDQCANPASMAGEPPALPSAETPNY